MSINDTPINEKIHETALVLANAGILSARIISKVAGNDVSTAVNGSPLTREVLQNLTFRAIEKAVLARKA